MARSRKPTIRSILASSLPALGLALGAGLVYGQLTAPTPDVPLITASLAPQAPVARTPSWVGETRVSRTFVRLLDSQSALGERPATFADRLPDGEFMPSTPPASFDDRFAVAWNKAPDHEPTLVEQIAPSRAKPSIVLASLDPISIPLPRSRPADPKTETAAAPSRSEARKAASSVALADAPAEPSFFEKLFGTAKPGGPVLAYAPSDGGIPGMSPKNAAIAAANIDKFTAVYDITAQTVYMPDGTKLEAHSGLGSRRDDPRYAHERMRGVTPPHIYDLTMRESLFHGVAAIRLNPIGGESNIYGRAGILAHTYMLGPNGDSNGCVSFRDYNAFLRAFRNGEVKRMLVVAKL